MLILAVAFNLHPGTSILDMAGSRVLLTVGGILLAVLMLLLLPRKQSS